MNNTLEIYLGLLLPAIVLAASALLAMMVEAFASKSLFGAPARVSTGCVAVMGFIVAAVIACIHGHAAYWDPSGMLKVDFFTSALTVIFCVGGVLSVLLSVHYLEGLDEGAGEYFSLLLFATAGAYLMAAANHLIMVFLGLEILSVAIYPLAGFLRRSQRSNEAALKYFLLGAFASAFMLYGISLIYGATGIALRHGLVRVAGANELTSGSREGALGLLRFDEISVYVMAHGLTSPIFSAGVALLLVGFCFKAALSPFHMWTPDVYDGAPTPITAYMSAVVKAAAFAPFFRFFIQVLGRQSVDAQAIHTYSVWVVVVAAIAILTMTWGNLAAVAEPSIKRMLAYSSVAHAGYITVALVAESSTALLFYMLVYTLMVVGSFGCVALLKRRDGQEAVHLNEWRGIGYRYPWFGAAFALFMFALAGFPPTAGFMGKLYIFRAALDLGGATGHNNGYVALVSIALINSLISVYYYLRVVVMMYTPGSAPHDEVHLRKDRIAGLAIAVAAVGTILLGVFPQIVLSLLPS